MRSQKYIPNRKFIYIIDSYLGLKIISYLISKNQHCVYYQ